MWPLMPLELWWDDLIVVALGGDQLLGLFLQTVQVGAVPSGSSDATLSAVGAGEGCVSRVF